MELKKNKIELCKAVRLLEFFSLLIVAIFLIACERDTKLSIEGGPTPSFTLTGSGRLGFLRITGPTVQRQIEGEDAFVYWEIRASGAGNDKLIEKLSPLSYGKTPAGYIQTYPQSGQAPPLVEGERYYLRVETNNANGVSRYFTIRNGNAVEEKE
jgi:hypothetical protein